MSVLILRSDDDDRERFLQAAPHIEGLSLLLHMPWVVKSNRYQLFTRATPFASQRADGNASRGSASGFASHSTLLLDAKSAAETTEPQRASNSDADTSVTQTAQNTSTGARSLIDIVDFVDRSWSADSESQEVQKARQIRQSQAQPTDQ